MNWIVYILECADKTLYTGITTNLAHRLHAHIQGKGAKYMRGRGPFSLLYVERQPSRSHALLREAQIKRLDSQTKRLLATRDSSHSPVDERMRDALKKIGGKIT